jgi:hypothetical protein
MFSTKNNITLSISKPLTPYCATCHRAGLSKKEYTNHWTKTSPGPDGVIVCPTILNTQCTYCHQKGHWVKFCPTIKNRSSRLSSSPPSIHNSKTKNLKNILKLSRPTEEEVQDDISLDFRPPSPDYPPPELSSKKSFLEKINQLYQSSTSANDLVRSHIYKVRDVRHDWSDDVYWSDDEDEIVIYN